MHKVFQKFRSIINKKGLDGFIVTNPYNILYLTGFKGISPTERESILTFSKNSTTLITARLYQTEAQVLAGKSLKVKIAAERNEFDNFIKSTLRSSTIIGFEETDLKYSEFLKYKKLLSPAKLVSIKNLIEDQRIIKSGDEIKKIEKAQIITQEAFNQITDSLKIGESEEEIAHRLAGIIRTLDGEGLAFETIVASGPNSGKPHHVTGDRRLTKNDTLLFDFGAKYQNYCADFSRTVFIGRATDTQRNIYNHVLTAQKKALAIIEHGIKHHEPFKAANNHFRENKLDEYFTHSLGHGIGLEVHEAPYLRSAPVNQPSTINKKSFSSKNQQLTNGMVFSVEPGLYFDWGGVRIEDLVTIKNGKSKVLGKLSKSLIEI